MFYGKVFLVDISGNYCSHISTQKKKSSNLPESRSQAKLSGVGCADASPSLESNLEEIHVLYIYIYVCVCAYACWCI